MILKRSKAHKQHGYKSCWNRYDSIIYAIGDDGRDPTIGDDRDPTIGDDGRDPTIGDDDRDPTIGDDDRDPTIGDDDRDPTLHSAIDPLSK